MSIKKIAVIGPESTGKSTLSAALAAYYQTVWVPEYARDYLNNLSVPYDSDDLKIIARGQCQLEDQLLQQASRLLICDTDLNVVKVWSEHAYGYCESNILEEIAKRRYDLYLLTYIDVAWEEDPLREHRDETMRLYFYHQYRDIVVNSGIPWADIRGNEKERLRKAVLSIDKLFS